MVMESVAVSTPKSKSKKKRDRRTAEATTNTEHGEVMDGVFVDDDLNEPTMGEKLATLKVQDEDDKSKSLEKSNSPPLPSADSVNILLKQALRADDRALLLDCLYTQDDKVIENSVALLNPADVLKLLQSLVSIIQSRGAVVVCAVPWLRSLLLHHASGIMSQQSSLLALNSLYQLIESRVSTFQSALQLSSCLDSLYAEVIDDGEEPETIKPAIYMNDSDSDEEESDDDDAMETETDEDNNEEFA